MTAADAAKSDPFTLAALGYFGSHCDVGFHGKDGLYGLLAIDPSMYRVPGAPDLPVDLFPVNQAIRSRTRSAGRE
jgi:hypothetical protein